MAAYTYSAYMLRFEVPFAIPGLPAVNGPPDVVVIEGEVSPRLGAPEAEGPDWEAEPGRFLLRGGARAGRFLVEDGERVTYHRGPAAQAVIVHALLLTRVVAAILRQRGFLVLHASAAALDGKAVAISGESGAGKSTTVATLIDRGATMLTDDVTAIQVDHSGALRIVPGAPQLHLSVDVASKFGHDISSLALYDSVRRKAAVPVAGEMASKLHPLDAFYWLEKCDGDSPQLTGLSGAAKFAAVKRSVQGPVLLGERLSELQKCASIAQRTDAFWLSRPVGVWSAQEVADTILERLEP